LRNIFFLRIVHEFLVDSGASSEKDSEDMIVAALRTLPSVLSLTAVSALSCWPSVVIGGF
jgi:hypothetical protein